MANSIVAQYAACVAAGRVEPDAGQLAVIERLAAREARIALCRIAREFHTIVLDPVPVMSFETRNTAKRFIILIDALYDMKVMLIASAAAAPNALYRVKQGFDSRVQAAPPPASSKCVRELIWRGRTARRIGKAPARQPGLSRHDRWRRRPAFQNQKRVTTT